MVSRRLEVSNPGDLSSFRAAARRRCPRACGHIDRVPLTARAPAQRWRIAAMALAKVPRPPIGGRTKNLCANNGRLGGPSPARQTAGPGSSIRASRESASTPSRARATVGGIQAAGRSYGVRLEASPPCPASGTHPFSTPNDSCCAMVRGFGPRALSGAPGEPPGAKPEDRSSNRIEGRLAGG